jgi:hypothetical protein
VAYLEISQQGAGKNLRNFSRRTPNVDEKMFDDHFLLPFFYLQPVLFLYTFVLPARPATAKTGRRSYPNSLFTGGLPTMHQQRNNKKFFRSERAITERPPKYATVTK